MSDVMEQVDIVEEVDLDIEEPPLYGVVFHNDNTTPIDFVVGLIAAVFEKSREDAEKHALNVHKNGADTVAVYDYDIADQKKHECDAASKKFGFKLKVTIEEQN